MTSLNDNLTVLHPPRGLYGCEHPRRRLLTAFERACHGGSEFILVTGHSGVGKTALVQELLKPVIQAQGIFVRGKFQEYRQVQPLLGPVQCMRQLCDWLLGQPEESAEFWRQRLLSGLGPEVGALFEWIPGLELFLGLQASSTPLPAIESQFRLRALLVRWVQLVASEAHPLVLVLDDLHWADPPSLEFIAALRENNALAGVLLIGLYRDDDAELNQSVMDRLMPSRDQMLHLQGLDRPSLQALLADMLGRPDQALDPLAEALHSATAGNPYFTIEQVHALHRDGLLQFDVEHGSWRWNMDEIRHRSMSANVVDFLQTRLDRLPAGVVDMLVALASLEAESTLGLLAKATGKTPEALLRLIVPALREGIVLTPDDAKLQRADPGATLHFCHDRMQQAVMERRNLAWREELHLSMARRLARGAAAAPSADLLRAAEHYAVAFHRIEAGEELRVAHSSFRLAARQARLVGSFALAERFLRLAIQSAPDQATASGRSAHWEIWVELHLACYCQSKYEEADALYERLKQEAPDAAALVESVCIQVMSLSNRTKYGEAVREGCNLLDRLGVIVPASAPGPALKKELQRFYDQLGAGQLERLERAEAVPDALWSAASRVINRMIPGTFFFDPQLACWLAVRVGCGWMDRGYRDSSIYPMACVILATISVRGDYASGYRAATRALSIGDRLERGVETERARHVVALFNNHWFAPLETSIDLAHTAYKGLFGTGELEFACYTYFTSQAATLDLSSSLLELDQETAQAFEFSGRTGNQHGLQSFLAYHQLSRTLQGKTGSPGSFSDETFQEATHLTRIQGNPMARAYFHIYRALSACFFDDDAALIEHAEHAATLRPFITGFYPDALANVLHSLALIARLRVNADADAAKTRHQLDENQRWLARRAADAPMNFGHLHDWIEAERLDLADQAAQSHDLYEQAMRRAKAHHRPWHQAVITHHAGRSLLRREWDQTAHLLLAKASGLYADWGAAGVVREMGLRYPFLAGRHSESMQPFGFANPEEESLWKASQVLASERSLLELVTRLTEMLRQLTGATQVSVLTQDEHGQWVLRGDESTAGYLEGLPLNKAISDGLIPGTVVRLGFKTSQIMLSEDALLDSRFAGDPYWNKFQRCSLLALPVQSRGNLNAFVVLENHLFRGAFTQQHVSRASLLCGQLAISIENALVYRSLELKVTERTSQLEAARRKEAGHAREMEKLLNNQPISVAICSLEANARILFVNEQFVRTFGYRLEEIPTVDAWAIKAYPDATYRQTTMNG